MKEGKPFTWIGDTAWELFHRLDREQASYYLSKRASQGFTVIQAVGLAELDGLNTPNPYGEVPLINHDPARPNEAYFKHVDFIIDKAAELDLNIAFLPTWGDKLFKASWGEGPEVFNEANIKIFGKWLASRYKDRKNIIWVIGGDRNPRPESNDAEIWRALAAGIITSAGGKDNVMMTFHPQPHRQGSGEWFHNDDWLDFNMFQNGHCRDAAVYDNIKRAYDREPAKPVIDGEPIYEDHPVCNSKDLGTSNAYDVRKAAYLDLFAGAFGHTYGCHDIWQMYAPPRVPINGAHIPWQLALELPAANQMRHVRNLIESRPMLDRVPDQSLVVEKDLSSYDRIQATRGKDYAFIYTSTGKAFTVNPGKVIGTTLTATWFDPKSGATLGGGQFDNKKATKFTPPESGYGKDWVLILDDASKNYPKP